ncbi:MAG: metal-dependent transcriptional regulator [Clostridia bacterium]|nr:metal-dependent transcriptional regulator [Clostridia bacterium]
MKNTESKEMYLETILTLKKRGLRARSVDVANELGFSRPSVSNAVKLLQKQGYITVGTDGELNFTENGQKTAERVYERHLVLTEILVRAGADKKLAEDNACRIEHVISDDMFEILKNYVNNK